MIEFSAIGRCGNISVALSIKRLSPRHESVERYGFGHYLTYRPDLLAVLVDGVVLARALEAAGDDVEQGLKRDQQARIERTTKVVLGSAENGKRFQSRTLADAASAEEYVNREWTPEKVRARYQWLYEYDVTRVPV